MISNVLSLIGRMGVPAAVYGVFWLARKYFPAAAKDSPSPQCTTPISDEHLVSISWMVYAGMVVVGVLLAWALHSLLITSNIFFAQRAGPAQFCLLPQTAVWWFLPGFAALTLSWEIILCFMSLTAGRELTTSYRKWSNLKAGFDSAKTLRVLAVLVVLPIAVATALAVPMHANLYEDEIRVRAYASAHDEIYRYSAARRLTQIEGFRDRNGKLTKRAGIVVDFSDGRRWSSADYGNFRPTLDPALANYLQQRIHLHLGSAETESDIPTIALAP